VTGVFLELKYKEKESHARTHDVKCKTTKTRILKLLRKKKLQQNDKLIDFSISTIKAR
jgi:hypothetical protein